MKFTKELEIGDKSFIVMIGGGGKTSGAFILAKSLDKSLVTTTTKMFNPPLDNKIEPTKWPNINSHKIPLVHSERDDLKYMGIAEEQCEYIYEKSEYHHIICEADGARMRPMKVWKEGEPVIPKCTTHTIINIGANVLGKKWGEKWVHRHEKLPFEGKTIDFDLILEMAKIGVFDLPIAKTSKTYLTLNQWDTVDQTYKSKTKTFAERFKEITKINKVFFASYKEDIVYEMY